MGRNKLKSFGPLMCQMALLINVRTGSFFFKALGITLLYMAGFPDELVCKETKYQSLDLLQKYYRSDKDAKEEQLFHPYPPFSPQGMMAASNVLPKALPAVSKTTGKKRPLLLSKPPSLQTGYFLQTFPGVVPSLQFGPSSFPLTPPLHPPSNSEPPAVSLASSANPSSQALTGSVLTTTTAAAAAVVPLPSPTFGIYPSYPVQRAQGGYSPVPLWPSLNPFPPNAFAASAYAYSPLSQTSQYGSALHTSCFGHAYFASYPPQSTTEAKQEDDSENIESGSESSSSGSDPKSTQANSSES
ncbi:hypothetical protein O6H91_03G113300 [Diphasiastrum complanatum]|nr:hypothetical protein O6H91_03G113300 [Diphasiastrum complanatum]